DRRTTTGGSMDRTKDSARRTIEDYDVLGELTDLANPQPKYRDLIELGGVVNATDKVAVLASRQAVETALKDPGTFSSEGFLDLGNTRPLIPLSVDPPRHVKYRKILDPLFAP